MNSFQKELRKYDIKALVEKSRLSSGRDVEASVSSEHVGLREFLSLLSPAASEQLEMLARKSRAATLSRFGRVIHLYAPLYLSNYCENNCLYCGFRKGNSIERRIQTPDSVVEEARFLFQQGFRSILLVAGEDPQRCDIPYLREVVSRVHEFFPSVSLEIGPQSVEDYIKLREAGAEGIIIYQETYDRALYKKMHPGGTKEDYHWRLDTPERVAKAGFHRIGVGALFGLGNPIEEAVALFLHTSFLLKNYWRTRVTISLPRMRAAKGSISPLNEVDDKTLTQIVCALRIAFPDIGIVLSTREEPKLRDGFIHIGATQMSAGSRTEPGGYLNPDSHKEQFHVGDDRSPSEIAEMLASRGYEPVWKDWETALV